MSDNEDLLKKWKEIKKKEERDNPYAGFIIDEGEFVEIKPGVQQLSVEELKEEDNDNGSSNDNSNISEQQRD